MEAPGTRMRAAVCVWGVSFKIASFGVHKWTQAAAS